MRHLFCGLLFSLSLAAGAAASPRPQGGHAGDVPWLTLEAAEAKPRSSPMLVYFGAEWCAPCKILETQVFNQPEVAAAMSGLLPVYIDGDGEGAPKMMERFKVVVFPTLLLIDAAGKETGRFVGSSEKAEMLAFLKSSTAAESPLTLLDAAARGERLTTAQWELLATVHVLDAWDAQYQDESEKGPSTAKRGKLSKAVAQVRAQDASPAWVTDVLGVKLLLMDAIGEQPAESKPSHLRTLSTVLADPELALKVRLELIEYSERFLDYLEPEGSPGRKALARQIVAALERLYDRPDTTPAWKLLILGTQLPMLAPAGKDVDAEKTRFAERAETELKAADSTAERLAIVQSAARVLRRTGRELRAEAVLREALKLAPEAYYLLGTLAAYANLRGDVDSYLELSARAYRSSLGKTNGLAYGSAWLTALIAHSPEDTARIASAADEVLGHAMSTSDAYLGWGDETMKRIANTLGTWISAGEKPGATMAAKIETRFRAVCESLGDDMRQAKACEANLALLSKPDAPPKS